MRFPLGRGSRRRESNVGGSPPRLTTKTILSLQGNVVFRDRGPLSLSESHQGGASLRGGQTSRNRIKPEGKAHALIENVLGS